ncbi:Mitochondrial inner membrane translocase subunit [Trema orientale]|uniref:Mitochondrial inner membrane translocase subunit n=1 Tax=Trema orientale TaxID=63057 RepID=A0A2P5CT30_TREOI|nr:Mitochondrial inner membrane translocase subunit [Trema orientale]
MPKSGFSGSLSGPNVDVTIDMGNPFLNLTVDGFLKIGTIAATRAAAEDAYHIIRKGTVAGVYVGMEYGVERIRGTRDWKNAMIGGALTGAVVSIASNNDKDKVLVNAITGGAIATAAEFINYLT